MPSVSSSPKDRDPNIPTSQCIEILKAPSKWYMCFRNKLIIWQIRTLDKCGQITVTSKCIHINSQYLSTTKTKTRRGAHLSLGKKLTPVCHAGQLCVSRSTMQLDRRRSRTMGFLGCAYSMSWVPREHNELRKCMEKWDHEMANDYPWWIRGTGYVWGKWWHVCCILVPWNGRNKCSLWCHLFSSSMHALFSLRSFWKNLLHIWCISCDICAVGTGSFND